MIGRLPAGEESKMPGHVIDLDDHRAAAGRLAIALRQLRHTGASDAAVAEPAWLDERQAWLLDAARPETWTDAVASVRELLRLVASTPVGDEWRVSAALERTVTDLLRLSERDRPRP
ncbi:MAG: hypothetical protein GVY27_10250 [Deinococcus-Thermus bacterium]|jgi:hypothetical protein|nr:hypothetical protein [Deinococcota bacterium]